MKLRLLSLLLFGLLISCQKPELLKSGTLANTTLVNTNLSFVLPDETLQETKASSINHCENVIYSYDLAIYEHNGPLIRTNHYSKEQIASFMNGAEAIIALSLPPKALDFYLVANMVYINKTSNKPCDVFTAFGASFPATSSGLNDLYYHIGDSNAPLLSGYRCLYFSEFKTYGIPMRAQKLNYTPSQGANISLVLEKLFAKVDLTVNLASLTGNGKAASRIINPRALVRHANYELRPFSNKLVNNITHASHCEGYYDDDNQDMDLASSTEDTMHFTLYLPANELEWTMPVNTKLNDITKTRLTQLFSGTTTDGRAYGGNAATYIEFSGTLVDSDNSIGYSGPLSYYFYIVDKAASNQWIVNVKRNKNYNIVLSFNPNSIFNPYWKCDSGALSDNRVINLKKYSNSSEVLEDGGIVVVRPNRPGVFYPYLNKSHTINGTNDLKNVVPFNKKDVVEKSDTYTIDDLEEVKYYYEVSQFRDFGSYDLMTSAQLAYYYGLEIVHNPSDQKITIQKIAESSAFDTRASSNAYLYLRFHFLPGDVKKIVKIVLAQDYEAEIILPDLTKADATTAFYFAEKRAVSIKGMYGVDTYQIKTEHDNSYYTIKAVNTENLNNDIVNTASTYSLSKVLSNNYSNGFQNDKLNILDFILFYYNHKESLNIQTVGVKQVYKDFPTKLYIQPDDLYNNPVMELDLVLGSDTFSKDFPSSASLSCDFIGNYSYYSNSYRLIKDGTLSDNITLSDNVHRSSNFFCAEVLDELLANPTVDLSGVSRNAAQMSILEDVDYRNLLANADGANMRLGIARRSYNTNNFNNNISTSIKYYFPNIAKTMTINITAKALVSGDIGNSIVLDDYSLINTSYFNSSHRQPSYNNLANSSITLLVDSKAERDLIRWKAKTNSSLSENIKISKNTDNASGGFSFSFTDGSNANSSFRTRGKHRLYCEFENKITGETIVCGNGQNAEDYPLGSFVVYQNLFVGQSAQFNPIAGINPSTAIDIIISPSIVGNVSKVLDGSINLDMIYYMEPINSRNYSILGTIADVTSSWVNYYTHLNYRFSSNNGVVQTGSPLSARVFSNNPSSYPATMLSLNICRGDGVQYSIFFNNAGVKDSDATIGYYKLHRLYDADYSTLNWVDLM